MDTATERVKREIKILFPYFKHLLLFAISIRQELIHQECHVYTFIKMLTAKECLICV